MANKKVNKPGWRGFFRGSVDYINPRGFKEWMYFLLRYPVAAFRFYVFYFKRKRGVEV